MCGIVGILYRDRGRAVPEELLRGMCAAIVHRGPDDEGVFLDGNLGMGMRRLSVIDVEGGHQPLFNEDGTVAVVYNGEIYNYPELRAELEGRGHRFVTRSDTEVLVHGYECWGADLPKHLNGMFGFSLWDAPRRRLLLARDHIGVKPVYIYESDAFLAWASEVKALLTLPEVRAELDPDSLLDYLDLGYVPAPHTLFRGIRKLPPATILVSEGERTHRAAYWDLAFAPEERSDGAWCEELRHLVDDAVRRQLVSDVPLGAFLSGGLDSSSIVATMSRLGAPKISTYAIGFGQEDAFHSELSKASSVARAFGTDHHEIVVEPNVADLLPSLVRHLDEPVTDTSFLVTYLVSKLARETVTVILSGVGGDEVFAGYRRYLWPQIQGLYGRVPGFVDRHVVRPLVSRLPVDRGSRFRSLARYARGFLGHADKPDAERYQGYVRIFSREEKDDLLRPGLRELRDRGESDRVAWYYREAPSGNPLNRMLYADLKTSLVDSLLAFTDKMTMAVSLEARVPLLDYRIVELGARIPPEVKLKGLTGMKHLFKLAMGDRLPQEILRQRKQGFGTPISRWFRGSLKPLLCDLLSPERLRRRGFFEPDAVWGLVDAHMQEREDCSEHLLALLTFELWHQAFLGGDR